MPDTSLRLFFALPCPAPVARRLDTWRLAQGFSGVPTARGNLHLTLAFLGQLPASMLPLLERLPPRLPLPQLGFDLNLDRLQCWPGGLLHLAPSQPPAALLELVNGLNAQLALAGLATEPRPYRPHLTLARRSHMPSAAIPVAFSWRVEELRLYRSLEGRYQALCRWPLGSAPEQ